jgi:hypothetical protein
LIEYITFSNEWVARHPFHTQVYHPEGQGVETETEKTSHPGQAAFDLCTLALLYGIHPVPAKCQSNPRKNKVMQKNAGAVPIRFRLVVVM